MTQQLIKKVALQGTRKIVYIPVSSEIKNNDFVLVQRIDINKLNADLSKNE
jgi:hypothetical protein